MSFYLITEMIRHVSCKILPESWQITVSIFFELLNTCSTAAESPMPTLFLQSGELTIPKSDSWPFLRAWRLALRMSQVGLDDILDILDVHPSS